VKLQTTGFESLPVKLTPSEHRDRSRQMAELHQTAERFEAEAKREAKAAKETLEKLKREESKLSIVVATEVEYRQVQVYYEPDLNRWCVESYRRDTGELVGSRPMTPDERASAAQGRLFEVEAGVTAASTWAEDMSRLAQPEAPAT